MNFVHTILFLALINVPSAAREIDRELPPPPPPEVEPALVVGILPDRTGGPDSGLLELRRAVGELEALAVDFVINIGDMVQGYTWSTDQWIAEAKEYKEIVGGLGVEWRPTAGNHDTFPGSRDSSDRTNENLYREHFAPLYYSYDVRDVHFVHLYSDEALTSAPAIGKEQIAWLERDLDACDAHSIFVFLHKPAWMHGEIWEPVHQILKRHPVKAVIAGHYHAYMKCPTRDGIAYYVIGAAGGYLHKPEWGGGFQHTCVLTIRESGWRLAIVKLGAIERDDYVLMEDYLRIDANGSYKNRDLWIAGTLPEPRHGESCKGEVIAHLANRADEPRQMRVTLDQPMSPGWSLAAPIELTLAPDGEVDQNVALSWDGAGVDPASPPTLLVHFLITDSKGRVVDDTRKLRAPIARSVRLVAEKRCDFRLDNWRPDHMESPADPLPSGHIWINGDRLELEFEFADRLRAHHPDQEPGGAILSDAIELEIGDMQIRAFPFQESGEQVFLRALDSKEEPRPLTSLLTTSIDDEHGVWSASLALPLAAFGDAIASAQEGGVTFNISVHDNDLTGFTTTYYLVKPRAEEKQHRGTLTIEK